MRDYILPLLPYNVKVFDTGSGLVFSSEDFISVAAPGFYDDKGVVLYETNLEQLINDDMLKIVLRPLSDIRKEIEIDGVRFTPFTQLTQNLQMNMDLFELPQILDLRVVDYQRLLKWNFDLFGLIEMGKGIDINTLP